MVFLSVCSLFISSALVAAEESIVLLTVQSRESQQVDSSCDFCDYYCDRSTSQLASPFGCCVRKTGQGIFKASTAGNRIACENQGKVWCSQGNNVVASSVNNIPQNTDWTCNDATCSMCPMPTYSNVPTTTTTLPPTPPPTPPPPTPPPHTWSLYMDDYKCSGKACTGSDCTAINHYECEQRAIAAGTPFYQWHDRQMYCSIEEDCSSPTPSAGYGIYRNPVLWPLKKASWKCTSKTKPKFKKDDANTQLACQEEAELKGWSVFSWNWKKKQCFISPNCKKGKAAGQGWSAYEMQ